MTNSILLTVKKILGISEEYHAFDLDIIIDINSVFLTLNQLGVGPIEPYQIIGEEETWEDFQGELQIPGVQTYVYLKTRLLFDPPTNSFLVDNMQKQIAELEWRMNIQTETPPSSVVTVEPEEQEPPMEEPIISEPEPDDQEESEKSIQTMSSVFMRKIVSTMDIQRHTQRGHKT